MPAFATTQVDAALGRQQALGERLDLAGLGDVADVALDAARGAAQPVDGGGQALAAFRARRARRQPRAASRRASARPIPDEPPVITARGRPSTPEER